MKSCLDYAIDHIYKFPKTESQLRTQLLKKGYSEFDINKSIEYLKTQNYVNDRKYVESYFHSECVKKGKPYLVIKSKLIQKGIDKEIINQVYSEMENEIVNGLHGGIKKEIVKYKKKGLDGFDIVQKLYSRGYSIDDIKKVL